MATVSAIRDGIVAVLQPIDGLRPVAYVKGSIVPPAAIVAPLSISFDSTMGRGSDDFLFAVTVFVSDAWSRTAQDALDAYCDSTGAKSIKAAFEADQDLNGVVHFARVAEMRDYGAVTYAGIQYIGAEFVIEVTA